MPPSDVLRRGPTGRYGQRSKIEAKPCEASARLGIAGRDENVPQS
jgi:hypothetical protein